MARTILNCLRTRIARGSRCYAGHCPKCLTFMPQWMRNWIPSFIIWLQFVRSDIWMFVTRRTYWIVTIDPNAEMFQDRDKSQRVVWQGSPVECMKRYHATTDPVWVTNAYGEGICSKWPTGLQFTSSVDIPSHSFTSAIDRIAEELSN